MDIPDQGSSRPSVFRPQGYLVAIIASTDEARRAQTGLESVGFSPQDIRLYPGKQILEDHEKYLSQRNVASKIVGAFTDDVEGRELYLEYAREDRCALWMRIPEETRVPKVLRVLAEYDYLHARYYGQEKQDDFHIE
jgi:hypothetical protein